MLFMNLNDQYWKKAYHKQRHDNNPIWSRYNQIISRQFASCCSRAYGLFGATLPLPIPPFKWDCLKLNWFDSPTFHSPRKFFIRLLWAIFSILKITSVGFLLRDYKKIKSSMNLSITYTLFDKPQLKTHKYWSSPWIIDTSTKQSIYSFITTKITAWNSFEHQSMSIM